MNWRLFFIGMLILVASGIDGFLLWNEEVVPPDAKTKAEARASDPLFGMQFTPSAREPNIQKMGFGPEEVVEILKKLVVFEDKYRVKDPTLNQIQVRIENGSDPDGLVAAFCGTGSTLPVRYAALPWIVMEMGEQLKVVDVEEISSFELQEWSKTARIPATYEEAELGKDRKEDATRMTVAAILSRSEQALLDHASPWGRGLWAGWSWTDVQKKHPGIRQRVIEYTALMHLVLEVANTEGGLCSA